MQFSANTFFPKAKSGGLAGGFCPTSRAGLRMTAAKSRVAQCPLRIVRPQAIRFLAIIFVIKKGPRKEFVVRSVSIPDKVSNALAPEFHFSCFQSAL